MTGPDMRARRSRFPDHPETVKVAVVQPIEMTMLRKLITTGDTWCTTCSNNGRNNVTEVCVMPCNARIHSASPIGALTDQRAARKEIVGGSPVEPEGQADKRHRRHDQQDAGRHPRH